MQLLLAKGAEADIYKDLWHGKIAIFKTRPIKQYRHPSLDFAIRKRRTLHEACIMSEAKLAGAWTPLVFFVDSIKCEIVMQFLDGVRAKECLTGRICREIGVVASLLHKHGIIHGDLTTSNFIVSGKEISVFDFGLSFHSERIEDKATDIRLFKEALSSVHVDQDSGLDEFIAGYTSVTGKRETNRILQIVQEIERRGRYARLE